MQPITKLSNLHSKVEQFVLELLNPSVSAQKMSLVLDT